MSYDNWKQTEPYDPFNEPAPEDETRFPCACGDPACYGYDDDPQNVHSGGRWFAADCRQMPAVVVEERERASQADIVRDDDPMGQALEQWKQDAVNIFRR